MIEQTQTSKEIWKKGQDLLKEILYGYNYSNKRKGKIHSFLANEDEMNGILHQFIAKNILSNEDAERYRIFFKGKTHIDKLSREPKHTIKISFIKAINRTNISSTHELQIHPKYNCLTKKYRGMHLCIA